MLPISQPYNEGANTCAGGRPLSLDETILNLFICALVLLTLCLVFQKNWKQQLREECSSALSNMAATSHMGLLACLMQIQMQMGSAWKYTPDLKQLCKMSFYSDYVLKYPGYIWLIKYTMLMCSFFFFNVATRKFTITHVRCIHCSHCISVGQHWSAT